MNAPASIAVFPQSALIDHEGATRSLASHPTRHFRGLLEAVRDHGCRLLLVFQGGEPFDLPKGGPWILLLGDDTLAALGPRGFHRPSLERAARAAAAAILVTGAPVVMPYNTAATVAARRRENAIVVATQPEQRDAWTELVRSARPDIGILVVGPEGGTG